MLASALGVRPEQARANLVAFNYLLSRYLVQDESSLRTALGASSLEETERRVVDTLLSTLVAGTRAP